MRQASGAFSLSDRQDLVEGVARVVAIDGGTAWLEPEQTTSCGGCGSAAACGTAEDKSARWLVARRFPIANEHRLVVGDRVVVGISESALLRGALTGYGLPLLGLLGCGITAQQMGAGDGVSALATLGGLVLGMLVARFRARFLLARGDLSPQFLRRAFGPGPGGGCHVA